MKLVIWKCAKCRLLTRKKWAKCPRCSETIWLKYYKEAADK